MTTMTHAAHAMSHTARSTHAVESSMGRSEARAATDASCCSHSTIVSTAHLSTASPMNSAAFPVNSAALTMNSLRVLRMRRCLA